MLPETLAFFLEYLLSCPESFYAFEGGGAADWYARCVLRAVVCVMATPAIRYISRKSAELSAATQEHEFGFAMNGMSVVAQARILLGPPTLWAQRYALKTGLAICGNGGISGIAAVESPFDLLRSRQCAYGLYALRRVCKVAREDWLTLLAMDTRLVSMYVLSTPDEGGILDWMGKERDGKVMLIDDSMQLNADYITPQSVDKLMLDIPPNDFDVMSRFIMVRMVYYCNARGLKWSLERVREPGVVWLAINPPSFEGERDFIVLVPSLAGDFLRKKGGTYKLEFRRDRWPVTFNNLTCMLEFDHFGKRWYEEYLPGFYSTHMLSRWYCGVTDLVGRIPTPPGVYLQPQTWLTCDTGLARTFWAHMAKDDTDYEMARYHVLGLSAAELQRLTSFVVPRELTGIEITRGMKHHAKALLKIGKRRVTVGIQVSGHLISMLLMCCYQPLDVQMYMDQVEWNVAKFAGNRFAMQVYNEYHSVLAEKNQSSPRGLWHTYYDYWWAVATATYIAFHVLRIPIQFRAFRYVLTRINSIRQKFVQFVDVPYRGR